MIWISNPLELTNMYRGFVFDIFGVLHDGHKAYPLTQEWLLNLYNEHKKVAFLSNSPLLPIQVEKRLVSYGIENNLHQDFVTAGSEARLFLEELSPGTRCFFIGDADMAAALIPGSMMRMNTLEESQIVILGGPDPNYDDLSIYDPLLKQAIDLSLPVLCANADMYVYESKILKWRAGALAQRYEEMGGQVSYYGKPYPQVYERILSQWSDLERNNILCVGDSLVTDIAGAQSQGLTSLLMVGPLCIHELELEGDLFSSHKELQEKISAKLAKGPYNPTYALVMD